MTKPSRAVFASGYWNQAAEIDSALQAEGAVFRVTMPNGVAVRLITRYQEARAALVDPRLSKDSCLLESLLTDQLKATGQAADLPWMFSPHMPSRDGKAHDQLRSLVLNQFGCDRVQSMGPRMEEVATRLLAGLGGNDAPVDLISEFAFPLPLTLVGDLLGIPESDRPALRGWTPGLIQDRQQESSVPASRELAAYLTGLIAARRSVPGDDLLSALATAAVDGDRLSDQEVVGSAFLMVVTGIETITNLLGNAARWLLEQPEVWRRLAGDPDLLARVIEEVLRFDSPMRLATRCTIAPVVYGGVSIPAGEIIMISLAAANRDPRRFVYADRLVWNRTASDAQGHLAFGHGLHHCLAAMIGRAVVEIGLAQLSDRFPHARLALPAGQLDRQESALMNGLQALPVLLGPDARR